MKIEDAFPIEIDIVRHGKWMHDKDDNIITGYCSRCGWLSIIDNTDVADMPYCPNCGCQMDLDEVEE